ncbi:MAG: hypothetical protein AB7W59_10920, partial [Acidimicrobiia bacterium]
MPLAVITTVLPELGPAVIAAAVAWFWAAPGPFARPAGGLTAAAPARSLRSEGHAPDRDRAAGPLVLHTMADAEPGRVTPPPPPPPPPRRSASTRTAGAVRPAVPPAPSSENTVAFADRLPPRPPSPAPVLVDLGAVVAVPPPPPPPAPAPPAPAPALTAAPPPPPASRVVPSSVAPPPAAPPPPPPPMGGAGPGSPLAVALGGHPLDHGDLPAVDPSLALDLDVAPALDPGDRPATDGSRPGGGAPAAG